MFRRIVLAVTLLLAISAATAPMGPRALPVHAAPVAAPSAHPAAFLDKTRVILHLAVAYGVFHHWIYKPFKAGDLNTSHKIKLVKAGLALLFAVHEVKKAIDITSHSNDGTLKKLNSVLTGLSDKFTSVGNLFHKDPSSLTDDQVAHSIDDLNTGVDASNKILNVPDAPVSKLGDFS